MILPCCKLNLQKTPHKADSAEYFWILQPFYGGMSANSASVEFELKFGIFDRRKPTKEFHSVTVEEVVEVILILPLIILHLCLISSLLTSSIHSYHSDQGKSTVMLLISLLLFYFLPIFHHSTSAIANLSSVTKNLFQYLLTLNFWL